MTHLFLSGFPIFVSPDDFGRLKPRVVIDVREPEEYAKGHVPGAVNLPVNSFLMAKDSVPFHMMRFDSLVDRFASLGVKQGDRVLIYSSASLPYHYLNVAALYMVLKHLGFRNVHVLDGGFEAWVDAGKPTSDKKGLRPRIKLKAKPDSSFVIGLDSLIVKREVVDTATGRREIKVVQRTDVRFYDLRVPGYYFGVLGLPFYRRRGHIPGARNLPFTFFLQRKRGNRGGLFYVMRDTSEIRQILKLNLDPLKLNVFYGNTPREAAFALMLLDAVGYPRERFRLYLNGFPEWSDDTALPVVRYIWE